MVHITCFDTSKKDLNMKTPNRLLFVAFLFCFLATTAIAQQHQTDANSEQPKSEVQLMLDEAKKNGDHIVSTCIENCSEASARPAGLTGGEILEMPKPSYPPLALRARASGQVVVQVIVGTDGKVIAAHSIGGHPLLQAAAVTAARDATFTPFELRGKPVKVVGIINYNFSR